MIRKLAITASIVFVTAAGMQAAVNTNAGIIFPEIENGAGARAAAMGGAYTAVADDAGSVYWNPAGLAGIKNTEVELTYDSWYVDSFFSCAMAAFPLPAGAIGAEIFYMNFGIFDRADNDGNPLNGSISPYTLAGFLAYGIKLGAGFSAGLAAKIISQSVDGTSASGFAGDAGLNFKTGWFAAGLTARNLGSGGVFVMPMEVKMGLAFNPAISSSHDLIISLNADYIHNDAFYSSAGLEYSLEKTFFLRAGYRYRFGENNLQGLSGITAGAGVKLGVIGFDYAFVPFGELGTSHRAVIKFEFGGPQKVPAQAVLPLVKRPAALTKDEEKMYKMFFEAGTLENSGKLAEAALLYRKMIKTDPSYAPAYKRLGAVFVKQGKKPEAVWCFEQYLKLKPDDAAVIKWMDKNK